MHETAETELRLRSVGPNAGAERSSLTNYHEYIREQRILTNMCYRILLYNTTYTHTQWC